MLLYNFVADGPFPVCSMDECLVSLPITRGNVSPNRPCHLIHLPLPCVTMPRLLGVRMHMCIAYVLCKHLSCKWTVLCVFTLPVCYHRPCRYRNNGTWADINLKVVSKHVWPFVICLLPLRPTCTCTVALKPKC